MPTGYTHAVQEGSVTTLREYALTCARAFSALVSMREDRADAPIPTKLEPNTEYHDAKLAAAKKLLDELPSLSAEECDVRAGAGFDEAMANHTRYLVDRSQYKRRYEEMLARVERWQVPEDLISLKEFMTSQLRESIRFDCGESYRPEPPTRLTGERWREGALAQASRDVGYHTVEREKEIQRTADRNNWLKSLWKALPAAEAAEAA